MTETIAQHRVLHRRATVELSMCGQHALFAARVGDWSWDTVSRQSGFDVLSARGRGGKPAYLAFSYLHIQAGAHLHPLGLAIGDELDVRSQAYNCGAGTVAVHHRIAPAEARNRPDPNQMHIRTLNHWVHPGGHDGNPALAAAEPHGFDAAVLPPLPEGRALRAMLSRARRSGSLARHFQPDLRLTAPEQSVVYTIDPSRDLNAAGIVYFAAYYSFIDSALLAHWRRLGRPDAAFLSRHVLDHKLCYHANAHPDTTLRITTRLLADPTRPDEDVADVLVHDHADGRLLAMSAIRQTSYSSARSR
ncbi:MAG TPA: LnmK family bifunctional acyltransferase/decarboxylase [Actinospica sp.]|nr:LnmK family bifunctional acyltransferase/decarboxylase [Actinospica sp.]